MFNVTVINIKGSMKRIMALTAMLVTIFIITRLFTRIKTNEVLQISISEKLINCLNSEIPAISDTYYRANSIIKEDEEEIEESFAEKLLSIELAQIQEVEQVNNQEIHGTENNEKQLQDNNLTISDVPTHQNTEIVTKNAIAESYNTEINGVKIKNETYYEINNAVLDQELNINKQKVLIFHTHTCESYTASEKYQYEQTGNFRTTDLSFSVSRVGDELSNYLTGYGISTYHDKTYHDYPAYSGSYTRSLATVENILKTNQSDIIIDLHRDAIGSKSNYDPSVRIGEEIAAQLMFVIGTNGGGLNHPNWQQNLKFAIELQAKANELYPGLFKPMIVRNSRYNQHLGKAACIIEVGATGNTLEQCLTSMKYLAKVLDEYKK